MDKSRFLRPVLERPIGAPIAAATGAGQGAPVTLVSILAAKGLWARSVGVSLVPTYAGTLADFGTNPKVYDEIGGNHLTGVPTGAGAIQQGIDINGYDSFKMDGTEDYLTHTAPTLGTSFDRYIVVGVGTSLAGLASIFGGSVSASDRPSLIASGAREFTARSDSAGPQTYDTIYNVIPGVHLIRHKVGGGSFYIDVDWEQMGSPYGRALAGSYNGFTKIGARRLIAQSFSNMGYLADIGFAGNLTDAEDAIVKAALIDLFVKGLFLDIDAGNDSNSGWAASAAYQNLSAIRSLAHGPGSTINFAPGGLWRKDPLLLNTGFDMRATIARPHKARRSGNTGAKWTLHGGTDLGTSGWTLNGTEWEKTQAATSPQGVKAHPTANSLPEVLDQGTAGALTVGQWAYTAGSTKFSLRLAGDAAPSTYEEIYVSEEPAAVADTNGIRSLYALDADNFVIKGWPEDGIIIAGDNQNYSDFIVEGCSNDGIGGTGNNATFSRFISRYNGKGRIAGVAGGPAGDGGSGHGASANWLFQDGWIYGNGKGGLDHQDPVNAIHRRLMLWGNYRNLWSANLAGTPGLQIWENGWSCQIVGDSDYNAEFGNGASHRFRNWVFVNNKGARGSTIAIRFSSTGTLDVQNCIFVGFNIPIAKIGGGTLIHGNNLYYDCDSNAPAGSLGGDVVADPLFVDRANRDFRVQAGSPALGVGAVVSLTDYLDLGDGQGNNRAAIPVSGPRSIGAYQEAA